MGRPTTDFRKHRALVARQQADNDADPITGVVALRQEYLNHLATDSHPRYALDTTTITAGAGLSGGGDLSSDRTIGVKAGFGIAFDGANALIVDETDPYTWKASHVWNQPSVGVASATFNIPVFINSDLSIQSLYPKAADLYDLGSAILPWRDAYISTIHATLFSKDEAMVHGGYDYITKNAGVLKTPILATDGPVVNVDLGGNGVAVVDDYLVMKGLDPDTGLPQTEYFNMNATGGAGYYLTRNVDGSGNKKWAEGSVIAVLGQLPNSQTGTGIGAPTAAQTTMDFGKAVTLARPIHVMHHTVGLEVVYATSLVSGTTYNVTRGQDGTTAKAFPAGWRFYTKNTAGWGNGRIELYALGAPQLSFLTQGNMYSDQIELVRIGSLSGWQGAGLGGYGWAIGNFATNEYAYYSTLTDLMEIRGTIKADAGYLGKLDISGVLSIQATGGIYQGTGTFGSPLTGLKVWNDGGIGRLATYLSGTQQIALGTNGKLYAGPHMFDSSGMTITGGNNTYLYRFYTTDSVLRSYDYLYWTGGWSRIIEVDGSDISAPETASINLRVKLGTGIFSSLFIDRAGIDLRSAGATVNNNPIYHEGIVPSAVVTGASQSIASGTSLYVTFNSVVHDSHTQWSSGSPTRLTCKVAGLYLIVGTVRFSANATGMRSVALIVNAEGAGRGNTSVAPVNGGVTVVNVAALTYLNIGDYVRLQAYQTSGAALTIDSVSPYSPNLSLVRVY